ncbi:MAG: M56 family metallopeptidase, partial [Verrucomicrobiota bacterium]
MSAAQWVHLVALLGVETLVLVGATALVERLTTRTHWRRGFWQAALLSLALLWLAEVAGFRRQPGTVAAGPASRTVTVTFGAEPPAGGSPGGAASPAPSPVARAAEPGPLQWPAWLWLAGTVGWLARAALLRVVLAGRVRRDARPVPAAEADALGWTALRASLGLGPVRLLRLAGLRGPVAFGVLRPTVAIPADFTGRFAPPQRQAMLAHELAHLAGRDPWWLWLANFAVALAWWHPAAWWARARLRAAGEAAADAASALVPDGPVALAESLVGFGRELTAPGGLGVAGSGRASELARRVQALLAPSLAWVRPGRALRLGSRSGAVAVAGALLLAPTGSGGKPWRTLAGETRPGPAAGVGRPMQTVSGLLADPQFRKVVTALDRASTQQVEFAPVRGGSMEVPAGVPRPGRTFPVDPWSFGAALGLSGPAQGLLADGTDPVLQERVRAWAAQSGVQFDQTTRQDSDRSIFYHDRENLLQVRADEADLKKLEQAIQRMPPHPRVKQAYVALREPLVQGTHPPAPASGETVPRPPTRGSPLNESAPTTEA